MKPAPTHAIGLALGGGGARGLAHLIVLETLDDMGVRPSIVAGTSIGAIIGALYCSGLSGREIRARIATPNHAAGGGWRRLMRNRESIGWLDFIDPEFGPRGLIKGERFVAFLYDILRISRFEELEIPLKVVATDFRAREQVVLDSGPLLPALKASMAIPGLFTPVRHRGRVLLDGTAVNPVPYDLLRPACDITIAVDVAGSRSRDRSRGRRRSEIPNVLEAIFTSFQIMQRTILSEKLARRRPDIYLRPDIVDVNVLEFHKAAKVYAQAEGLRTELKDALSRLIAD